MSDHVFWNLELAIRSGEVETVKTLMSEMVESANANEPGTLNYEWSISEDSEQCHIYERYADSAAVMTHLGTFGEKFADRFLAVLEPKRLLVYGRPSAEAIEALSGFGAVFMTPIGGFAR